MSEKNLDNLKYYQNYHKHTSQSHRYNKDSPLVHTDYFKYITEHSKEFPQIYSTVEHGWQGVYFRVYDDLEKYNKKNNTNIKFIFGTEMYWVKNRFEKDSANCHIILLAKNENGRKSINKLISTSYKTGYYYKGRCDLELLLNLPKSDVFVTTACIAFWNKYDDIDDIVFKLNNHFDDFFLEVQSHNTEKQININKHILDLSNKYNIPIIAGVDSHIISNEHFQDREDLLKSNTINYEDEDGWYLDYPTIDILIKRFQEQNIFTDDEIYKAINNTNLILDFEDIILNRDLKVPILPKYKHLSQLERNNILKQIVKKEISLQKKDFDLSKKTDYINEIKYNLNEIIGSRMTDYFIDNYETMNLGISKYGGILTPSGRGSGVSFLLNKILGFTKVDKVNSPVEMYAERFLTKDRILESKQPPDIDHNVSDRQPFIQAQRELMGEYSTYDLIALGTLKYKSAFKMYARAYDLDPQLANEVSSQITKYEKALKYAEDDEKDTIYIYDFIDIKYKYLIDGCKQYMGIIDNLKGHPCSTICYDGDVESEIGIILCKSETTGNEVLTAVIESGTIDSFGFLKQDYLIVDSIGLTYDIYKEIGIEPFTVNELLSKIENDNDTWNIYSNGETMCINQCESVSTTKKVMKYQPKNISELTQFIAGIRPSFKTMYPKFEKRESFEYGIKTFDNLIQDKYIHSSWILYQEQLMKVLAFAGFEMKDTYSIIKAISKKKTYVINDAKSKFIPNFTQAILNTKEITDVKIAKNKANEVWKIIEDSASYGFNCLSGDTIIKRDRNNKWTPTIEEMWLIMNDKEWAIKNNHKSLHEKYNNMGYGYGLSLKNGRIYKNKIIDIYKKGIETTYTITTESGKKINATLSHKFPTQNGIKTLSELSVGENLYIMGEYEKNTNNEWLCVSCHKKRHYENGKLKKYEKGIPTYFEKVISIDKNKEEVVYDVSMSMDVGHNFVVDSGIVTCNCSHAFCMAIDSATLAYLKAHYPLEFYKCSLQRYTDKNNKDKISLLKQELLQKEIILNPIKFTDDNRSFSINKNEKSINQTMASIKDVQKIVPEIMFEIGNKKHHNLFSIFKDISNTKINKKSLSILIKLNYFKDFGDISYVEQQLKAFNDFMIIFDKIKNCKQINKEYLSEICLPIEKCQQCCNKSTNKQLRDVENVKLLKVLMDNFNQVYQNILIKYPYRKTTIVDSIKNEIELLSYTNIKSSKVSKNIYIVLSIEENSWGTKFAKLYCINDGKTITTYIDKKWLKKFGLGKLDVIKGNIITEPKNRKATNKELLINPKKLWYETNEMKEVLNTWYKIVV